MPWKTSTRSIKDRILERCIMLPISEGSCWLWTGAKNKAGYGIISRDGRKQYVHRIIMELEGFKPGDLTVEHWCKRTLCVNPQHLSLITREENASRGNSAAWAEIMKKHVAELNALTGFHGNDPYADGPE